MGEGKEGAHPRTNEERTLAGPGYSGDNSPLPPLRQKGVGGTGMTGPGLLDEPAQPVAGDVRPEFGRPLSPSRRRLSSQRVRVKDTLWPRGALPPKVQEGTVNRPWEKVVLDKGRQSEKTYEGRTYTIGEDHPLIDIWNFPPDSRLDAKRIATIKGCRLFILRAEKPRKKDNSTKPVNRGWRQMLVFEGVSQPESGEPEELMNFEFDGSRYRFVYAEWKDITRKKTQ